MTGAKVARRYAKALLALAEAQGRLDETGEELASVSRAVEGHGELRALLINPQFRAEAKRAVLEALVERMGLSQLVRGFLLLVLEKGRVRELPAMAHFYRRGADERRGRVRAEVRAAAELDPGAVARLRERLARLTGKEVILQVARDPQLIGGLVVQMDSTVMDGSVRTQLQVLREKLLAD
ncbi:MAG: ATP synthase F1 subunit delta [Nitrospinota bacterium]